MKHGATIRLSRIRGYQRVDTGTVSKISIRPDALDHHRSWLQAIKDFNAETNFTTLII